MMDGIGAVWIYCRVCIILCILLHAADGAGIGREVTVQQG